MPDPNLDSASCSAAAACSGSTSSSPLAVRAARAGPGAVPALCSGWDCATQPLQEQPSAPSAPGRRRRPLNAPPGSPLPEARLQSAAVAVAEEGPGAIGQAAERAGRPAVQQVERRAAHGVALGAARPDPRHLRVRLPRAGSRERSETLVGPCRQRVRVGIAQTVGGGCGAMQARSSPRDARVRSETRLPSVHVPHCARLHQAARATHSPRTAPSAAHLGQAFEPARCNGTSWWRPQAAAWLPPCPGSRRLHHAAPRRQSTSTETRCRPPARGPGPPCSARTRACLLGSQPFDFYRDGCWCPSDGCTSAEPLLTTMTMVREDRHIRHALLCPCKQRTP
jgi:hypothetical protein